MLLFIKCARTLFLMTAAMTSIFYNTSRNECSNYLGQYLKLLHHTSTEVRYSYLSVSLSLASGCVVLMVIVCLLQFSLQQSPYIPVVLAAAAVLFPQQYSAHFIVTVILVYYFSISCVWVIVIVLIHKFLWSGCQISFG